MLYVYPPKPWRRQALGAMRSNSGEMKRKYWVLLIFCFGILLLDQWTKCLIVQKLTLYQRVEVIQGFFNIPFDHLYATPVLLEYLQSVDGGELVVVSPDAGGVERARAYAKRIHASLAIIDKRRPHPNVSEVLNIVGDENTIRHKVQAFLLNPKIISLLEGRQAQLANSKG